MASSAACAKAAEAKREAEEYDAKRRVAEEEAARLFRVAEEQELLLGQTNELQGKVGKLEKVARILRACLEKSKELDRQAQLELDTVSKERTLCRETTLMLNRRLGLLEQQHNLFNKKWFQIKEEGARIEDLNSGTLFYEPANTQAEFPSLESDAHLKTMLK